MVCFFVCMLVAPAAAAAAAAISCADRSLDLLRLWGLSVLGVGADVVLPAEMDAAETSSDELFGDSVACRTLLGRIGEAPGKDLTLVGVWLRSWTISAEALAESSFT